nr:hypothetical protein [Bdellovibrionales bacterium]
LIDPHLPEAVRKRMIDASGDVASLSYNRAKIEPDDAGYPAAQDALARFSTAMKNVNAKLLDYSRESNTLADKITERKLYYNFDLVAWQKRVQKSLRLAQENQEGMNKEITRAENALKNWNKPELRARQDDVFAEMQGVAQTHSERASRLGPLSKEMSDVTLSNPKITSLNKEWPEVQKLQLEFEQLQAELMQLNERFERKSEAFRNPFKRAQ